MTDGQRGPASEKCLKGARTSEIFSSKSIAEHIKTKRNNNNMSTEQVTQQLQSLSTENKEQKVTPWDVEGAVDENGVAQSIDYEKLIKQFGTRPISDETLARFEAVTGQKPHHFLRKGVFFSERDFTKILDLSLIHI